MAEKKTDAPEPRATPLEAGEAVEQPSLSQMGGTFAERKKAREKAERAASKSVDSDTDAVEDKAVSSKKTAKK